MFTVARGVLRANVRSSSSGREIERHTHSPVAGRLIPAGLYGHRTSRETSSASRARSLAAAFTPEGERIAPSASLDLRTTPRPRHAKPGRMSLSAGGAKTLGRPASGGAMKSRSKSTDAKSAIHAAPSPTA